MNTKLKVLGILSLGISSLGYAQKQADSLKIEQLEEVVITDSRFNLKRENSGKVITKITQDDLKNLKGKSVAEILNTTAGIDINGTRSNAAQNLSYFVRGGRNRQVLIMIDGVPLTDASQISNDYDLRLLSVDQVESIEILKGASSTLYGTGAATAVINIKLKKASDDVFNLSLNSNFGTNQSQEDDKYALEHYKNSVSINGTVSDFSYLASFGHQFTDGLSAIDEGEENDAFNSHNAYLNLAYRFSNAFKIKAYGSTDTFKAEFDEGFSFADADNQSVTKQYRLGLAPEFQYKHGNITLNAAYNNIERDIQSSFPTRFKAKSFIGDLFNRYNFNDTFYTVLGVNVQDNQIESYSIPFGESELSQDISPEDASFTIVDPYANVVYVSDFGLNINAGIRLNNHSEYGSHFVYSVNPSYKKTTGFGYLKGLASYSTAFIAPSLYQLFEPTHGNLELEPEENRTIELGAEVNFKDKATISLVYFNREEKNFVDFVDQGNFVFQYDNIDKEFTASGFELVADVLVTKKLKFLVNGSYTKVEDELNLRIPEVKVNANLNYNLNSKTFMSLSYQFNDDRRDAFYNETTFATEDVTLKSYSLLDFYISRKVLKDKLTLYVNMTNILNEDYQELLGYTTKGRNVLFGFNLNL
ncbi:TonB-dependent receptor plug domain-containing protein [Psychroserpens sp. XS_ASV72]|uniref:TonB-dependent receptor plug domain-containing protein n=1 Tax=Psychroserpens sp. XS_ASV72 TaxID=3241293 RepID=UPI003513A5A5